MLRSQITNPGVTEDGESPNLRITTRISPDTGFAMINYDERSRGEEFRIGSDRIREYIERRQWKRRGLAKEKVAILSRFLPPNPNGLCGQWSSLSGI